MELVVTTFTNDNLIDRQIRRDFKRSMINENRRKQIMRQKLVIKRFICALTVTMIIALMFGSVHSYATVKNGVERTKCYKSVMINSGDTLDSIAEEYISIEFRSKDRYINEVKSINHLDSDTIHAGGYLVVPYFE